MYARRTVTELRSGVCRALAVRGICAAGMWAAKLHPAMQQLLPLLRRQRSGQRSCHFQICVLCIMSCQLGAAARQHCYSLTDCPCCCTPAMLQSFGCHDVTLACAGMRG